MEMEYKITEEQISEILSLMDQRKTLAVKKILVNLEEQGGEGMKTTHVMNINTENPDSVCIAINKLVESHKSLRVLTIIKEGLNHWIYYQIGENKKQGDGE